MATGFDKHQKLLVVTSTVGVIAAWFGAMYLLVFLGVPQNWIVLIAPLSSAVVAGIFLYLGRKKLRRTKSAMSAFELDSPVIVESSGGGAQSADLVESTPPSTSTRADDAVLPQIVDSTAANETPAARVTVTEASSADDIDDTVRQHSEAPDSSPPKSKITDIEASDNQSAVTSPEIPPAVKRVMDEIERKADLRCIIIAAPSHGVLQDRLNNWLSGGYGRVVSASMAMNGKGFYLTVFYEPITQ